MFNQGPEKHRLAYRNGELIFELHRSNRKTLGIQVLPQGSVKVIAPLDAEIDLIYSRVKKRLPWITKQKDFFSSFEPRRQPRKYVSGETHLYLGRRYRLKIHHDFPDPYVKLRGQFIHVGSPKDSPSQQVQTLMEEWYKKKAKYHFQRKLDEVIPRFSSFALPSFNLKLRKMKTRWGSCTPNGNIYLNPELILAPKACIEYVIIHELCHLLHPSHNKDFYVLQDRIMPDWSKWKVVLENILA
ncbi:MAG: SprT family zinc-dependent metalloprotease [Bacteroidia bacterium]